jgi:prenylcysteine oxidase / farnesylcysteine lyase
MMLTTYEGVRNGGVEPEFNSLSYHGLVREGEWAVKIFSKQRISDEWLSNMFFGKVGWVYRKEVGSIPPT